ncbi:hypothetical protein [Pseudomonas vanderleydeniana]|uniref:Uncharacterized protein n=1 Tax=Pseudomonas vanderleydeniana TaxID=2745495 RepID=A0A9E6PRX8_9PSED|nr:hypothetical protein [Pseudomonas vanderleydeniana]QXI31670.1 hypothetical protein HU752_011450 [Pseudomonas vanderleydeniana]
MSKSSPVVPPDSAEGQAVAPDTVSAAIAVGPARVFRDKVYTSRTLVMSDGSTIPVARGRVSAAGDDQYAFLKAHPEFEPLQE